MTELPFLRALPLVVLAALGATGCSDDPATETPTTSSAAAGTGTGGAGGAGGGGAGGAGGAGGGEACPPGSHSGATACEATLTGWDVGPSLLQRRDHHVTFIVEGATAGPFLYVAGGIEDNQTDFETTERAPILEDGSLGPWEEGLPMPETAAGAGVAVVGDVVVVTGGFRFAGAQPYLSKETDVATVQPDGSLGPWTQGPEFHRTRFHHAMAAHGTSLYVIGGLTGNNTNNTPEVERATVGEDGVVGPWTATTPLPERRSHHSVAVHEDALYVIGGLIGDPANNATPLSEILRAEILADGAVGAWIKVGDLPVSLGTHASFVHAGQLYVAGGIENDTSNTAAVRRASIGADGTIGAWEDMPALPAKRAHAHQLPLFRGVAYAAGGALNHVSIADTFIGRFE